MPTISVPQPTALPTTAITDTRRLLPPGLFDDQAAAGQGLARAVGQGAQVLGQAAVNTLRAQGAEEFTRAKLDYETEFRNFQSELLTDTDYAGYTKKFNEWHDGFTTERAKQINHRGAQTRAKQQFDLNRAVRGRTIDANAQNALVRQTRALLGDKIDAFVSEELQADTPETIKKADTERKEYFQTLIETGVLNAAEAEVLEKQYQEAKAERVLENTVTGIAVEEGWDEAMKFLNDPKEVKRLVDDFGVELADIDRILEDVRTQANLSRAEGKAELENQRKTDRQAILNKLIATDFTDMADFVNATALSPTEKLSWIEKSETRAAAINAGKADPMNQTNPAKYFEIRRKIETDPGSVTEADLAAAVGEGISIDDYETLLKIITDKNDPRNAPSAKRGQAVISRLRQLSLQLAKEDPDLDPREIELNALAVQNEYDQWLVENPKATDEEKEKKVRTLTEPARDKTALSWFDRLTRPSGRRIPLTILPFARATEEEALVDKKIDVLKGEGIWQKLSKEDKASARRAFERGGTVQEVIDSL